jgi:hypothetical protein
MTQVGTLYSMSWRMLFGVPRQRRNRTLLKYNLRDTKNANRFRNPSKCIDLPLPYSVIYKYGVLTTVLFIRGQSNPDLTSAASASPGSMDQKGCACSFSRATKWNGLKDLIENDDFIHSNCVAIESDHEHISNVLQRLVDLGAPCYPSCIETTRYHSMIHRYTLASDQASGK